MSNDASTDGDTIEALADSFVARFRAGERPSIEEYARRYPELADELRELLPALVMLEQNASPDDTAAFAGARKPSVTPTEIGEFAIIREIGRGGMGVVYEAVQRSLGRHVALKVLTSPGLLNPTHLERFHLEARAAARLHHTHIVPVFGVGEHGGAHYYAMQYIQGQSLDMVIEELRRLRWLANAGQSTAGQVDQPTRAAAKGLLTGQFHIGSDGAIDSVTGGGDAGDGREKETGSEFPAANSGHSALGPAEHSSGQSGREFYRSVARVGLQAAEALNYAHGEGILHRDIKPSNLLLNARGNVWITDFGLAKAEGSDGLTQTGDIVGTLRYMAPERLEGWSDRRSDLYSLGATLYELLTLKPFLETPHRGQLVDKILHENPSPPSTTDRHIPRDLETIILKAIAKEPASRYHTAQAMAEDLQRFLADRSILARRSSAAEQFVRWCRRNPLAAMLTAAVFTSLVAGTAVSAWQAIRATRAEHDVRTALDDVGLERDRAKQAQEKAIAEAAISKAINKFLRDDLLNQAAPKNETDRDITLRTVLDRAAAQIDQQFKDQPAVEAGIRQTIGSTYASLGEFALARPYLERALAINREHLGDDDPATLLVLYELATLDFVTGYYAAAEAALLQALAGQERTLGPDHQDTLLSMNSLATLYWTVGENAKAEQLFSKLLEIQRRKYGDDHADVLITNGNMANVLLQAGRTAEAEALVVETLEKQRRLLGNGHADVVGTTFQLGATLADQKKYQEARPIFEDALAGTQRIHGKDHPLTLNVIGHLASVYKMLGDLAAAEAYYLESLEGRRRKLGELHPDTVNTLYGLAGVYQLQGKDSAAEELFTETLELQVRVLGNEHVDTANTRERLTNFYIVERRFDKAETLCAEVLAFRRRYFGSQDSRTAQAMVAMGGNILFELQKYAQGEALLEEAKAIQRKAIPVDRVELAETLALLGQNLLAQRKFAAAEPVLRECASIRQQEVPNDWTLFNAKSMLGESLASQQNLVEAESLLVDGYQGLRERQSRIPPERKDRVVLALDRLVAFYQDRGSEGDGAEAKKWQAELEAQRVQLKTELVSSSTHAENEAGSTSGQDP